MYIWLFIVYTFNLAQLIINVTHTQTHTHLSTNIHYSLLHRNLPFSTLYIFFHVPFLGTFQTHF